MSLEAWKPLAFKDHAFISPSALPSTALCSMSPWLSSVARALGVDRDDVDTEGYTDEGNEAHALLEDYVKGGDLMTEAPAELASNIMFTLQEYQTVLSDYNADTAAILSEQNFVIDDIDGCAGTADLHSIHNETLFIGDLKYGIGVEVFAEDNWQIMAYALGAIAYYSTTHDIKRVVMFIAQPRLSHYSRHELSRDELYDWANDKLTPAIRNVFENPEAVPGPKQCQFCAGAGICNGLKDQALPPVDLSVDVLTREQLGTVLANKSLFNKFMKEAEKRARVILQNGDELPGVKLIPGNRSRVFIDSEKAAAELESLGVDPYHEPQMLSAPQAVDAIQDKEERQAFESEHVMKIENRKARIVPSNHAAPAIGVDLKQFSTQD